LVSKLKVNILKMTEIFGADKILRLDYHFFLILHFCKEFFTALPRQSHDHIRN